MRIIIVRHGETGHNARNLIQGHTLGTLSAKGREQVKRLALRLKNEKIDVILSSDLKRAADTANEIAKYHDAKVLHTQELRERNMGEFEGRTLEEFLKARDESGVHRTRFRPNGGESYIDMCERAKKFLEKIKKYNGRSVLIVAHGAFNKALLAVLLDKTMEEAVEYEQHNTCVNIIEIKEGKAKAHVINSIEHLQIS